MSLYQEYSELEWLHAILVSFWEPAWPRVSPAHQLLDSWSFWHKINLCIMASLNPQKHHLSNHTPNPQIRIQSPWPGKNVWVGELMAYFEGKPSLAQQILKKVAEVSAPPQHDASGGPLLWAWPSLYEKIPGPWSLVSVTATHERRVGVGTDPAGWHLPHFLSPHSCQSLCHKRMQSPHLGDFFKKKWKSLMAGILP